MKNEQVVEQLGSVFPGFEDHELPSSASFTRGKVRDIWDLGKELLIITSDRISAFDRVLTTLPCKGDVLNRLSNFWFTRSSHLASNHFLREITPRATLAEKCELLPVEVVVRGYLTGSAWRDYEAGRDVSGTHLPEGMKFNQRFDVPLLTPSTKAEQGLHDEPISPQLVLERGLVDESLWRQVVDTALALFEFGSRTLAERGLILVDTKYEFGMGKGGLTLVDEMHTPDSSRFWFSDTYEELFRAGS